MSYGDDKLPHANDGVEGDADIVVYRNLEFEKRFNCVDDSRMTLSGMSLNMMSDAVIFEEVSLLGEKTVYCKPSGFVRISDEVLKFATFSITDLTARLFSFMFNYSG